MLLALARLWMRLHNSFDRLDCCVRIKIMGHTSMTHNKVMVCLYCMPRNFMEEISTDLLMFIHESSVHMLSHHIIFVTHYISRAVNFSQCICFKTMEVPLYKSLLCYCHTIEGIC